MKKRKGVIITFIPILLQFLLILFLLFFFFVFQLRSLGSLSFILRLYGILSLITNIWLLFVLISFIYDLYKNNNAIGKEKKTFWLIILLILGPFGMIAYWYDHILRRKAETDFLFLGPFASARLFWDWLKKGKNKRNKIIAVSLIIIFLGGAGVRVFWSYRNKKKMLKVDECIERCPMIKEREVDVIDRECREECLERYNVKNEKYLEWKVKNILLY